MRLQGMPCYDRGTVASFPRWDANRVIADTIRTNLELRAKVPPDAMRQHAAFRIEERYHIRPTKWLIYRIERLIQQRHRFAIKICNQYLARSIWAVTIRDHILYVVYDDFSNALVTALDPSFEVIVKWKERQGID